jgi:O-antigen/teichoic acid export membrane protein
MWLQAIRPFGIASFRGRCTIDGNFLHTKKWDFEQAFSDESNEISAGESIRRQIAGRIISFELLRDKNAVLRTIKEPMKRLGQTVTKNAIANVVRGGASALAAVALPHFLTHALDHDHFAAWALMLQIAAYANYLDFGLQTAVARYLAQAIELGDDARRDQLVTTALGLLSAAGMLALFILEFVVWRLPHIFHGVPVQTISEMQTALTIMVVSAVASLPMSAFTGVLIGLHRNEYPAIAVAGSRILSAAAVLLAARYTHSLAWLALCLAGCNLLGNLAQVFIARRLLPSMRVHVSYFRRAMTRELAAYCSTLAVWSIGMLLISGLDVTIVGFFNFAAVGYYSVAVTLINVFTGINASIFGALMTPVAVMQARKEHGRIRHLVITATQLNSYACLTLTIAAFLFGGELLRLWVGPLYATQALPILVTLMVAQTVRLMGSAYGTALVATGQQHYGLSTVLTEAVLNATLSVIGMLLLGPVGVAWATLIAALVALALQVLVVIPRVKEISLDRKLFVSRGIVQPVLALLAPMIWLALRGWYEGCFQPSLLGRALPAVFSLAFAGFLTWAGLRSSLLGRKTRIV